MERFLSNLLPVSDKPEPISMLLNDRVRFSTFILVIFYAIGIVGILIPIHSDFILLTPYNLLLSLGLLFWSHPKWNLDILAIFGLCFVVGFGVEVAGVNTGLIFGTYAYGPILGYKIWNTPLMIGVNWLLLVYASGVFVNKFFPNQHFFLKATIAALIMVILDLLIEPVAIAYDFWTWEGESVPLQNYLAWFFIAWFLQLFFMWRLGKMTNKVGIVLLILQFLFFGIINIALNL